MRALLLFGLAACVHRQPAVAEQQPVVKAEPVRASRVAPETSLQEVLLAEVKKVLASAQLEVRSCYEAILTPLYHPDIDLVIRLLLRADGTVRRIEVVRMVPDVAGLVACFSGVLGNLKFPSDSEDWELEFPVKLRSGGMADDVEDNTPAPAPKVELTP
jgi:hypothetical protein